jgi:hypothetical protein
MEPPVLRQVLKEHLEINMHIRDDNTEMDVKETSFVVDLILEQNE